MHNSYLNAHENFFFQFWWHIFPRSIWNWYVVPHTSLNVTYHFSGIFSNPLALIIILNNPPIWSDLICVSWIIVVGPRIDRRVDGVSKSWAVSNEWPSLPGETWSSLLVSICKYPAMKVNVISGLKVSVTNK